MVEPMTSSRRDFLKGLAATIAGGVVLGGGAAVVGKSLATAPDISHFTIVYRAKLPMQDIEDAGGRFEPELIRRVNEYRDELARLLADALKAEAGERPIAWRVRPTFREYLDPEHDIAMFEVRARGVVTDDESMRDVDLSSEAFTASFGEAGVRIPTRG